MEPERERNGEAVTESMPTPYKWRLARDLPLFLRATATNQLARVAPALYTRLTGETGRGHGEESPESVAAYFRDCLDDYRLMLGRIVEDADSCLGDATIVEYGPGDVPGVALGFIGAGAKRVLCVDRFPLMRPSAFNQTVLDRLAEGFDQPASRHRFNAARQQMQSVSSARGADPAVPVSYLVDANGYSRLNGEADLVISRAVLEHVNDLQGTFRDMYTALRPGGIALHKVDLRSHGLHRESPLDFLTWPRWAWWLMHSSKGTPNRWRLDRYRTLAREVGFQVLLLESVETYEPADIIAVKHALAGVARSASDEELRVATFWLAARKPDE